MNLFNKLINWYFRKNSLPYWCIFLIDCVTLFLSGVFTYWLFNKTAVLVENRFNVFYTMLLYVLLAWVGFRLFHTYAGIVRYSSFVDLTRVAKANIVSLILSVAAHYTLDYFDIQWIGGFTLTETFTTYIIATLMMGSLRILVKSLYDVTSSDKRAMRTLIYGAMAGGVGLAKNIRSQKPVKFQIRGFISHDDRYRHTRLMGERVYGLSDNLEKIIKGQKIEAVIVSPLRTREFQNNTEIQDLLISYGVKIFLSQSAQEMMSVNNNNNNNNGDEFYDVKIKEVSVEDLLPRDEIRVDMKSVGELLQGKRIMITGAAGSIGTEMVRQIAIYHPAAMMLIDQAETPEHDIRLMMARDFSGVQVETVVTSICNQERMEKIFNDFRPDYVFHAAAYKHVPMMEDNPSEAVQNNIYGTKVIADLSVKYGTKKFVMVSTDKAVNPTNVMGCSKRICEMYVQALDRVVKRSQYIADSLPFELAKGVRPVTQFVTTRFGNVLGSNGSVIPLFREQIKKGGPVTVTHPDIIRFFMLIPEACQLVLEAGTKGNGGEIFVFDMGKPVRIAELAARMIRLSGARNVKIEYTGLREGEKLYEEVLSEAENTKPTFHEKIRIAEVQEHDFYEISKEIDELIELSKKYDNMATVRKMKIIVPEYKSNNSIYEELDKEDNKEAV